MKKVTITRDGVWAGDGLLRDDGVIVDCPAILGSGQDASDETYELLADALEEDALAVVTRPDGEYIIRVLDDVEFSSVSDCPPGWTSGLEFDEHAVWVHRDGRRFISVMARPSGGNTLLLTPEQWRLGWSECWGQVFSSDEILTTDGWLGESDFAVVGTTSL